MVSQKCQRIRHSVADAKIGEERKGRQTTFVFTEAMTELKKSMVVVVDRHALEEVNLPEMEEAITRRDRIGFINRMYK